MASQKGISMGFLFLICLGISSAHRLLLDSIDDNKPKESTFNLAGGVNGGGVGLTGLGGYGGFRGGGGCGLNPCPPRFGQIEPFPPADSCTCLCPCGESVLFGGGWAPPNLYSNSPAHLELEFAGSMGMPSGGSNMGAHNEPITPNDAKDHHEAHKARSGYGPFEVPTNDGEPMPPDNSEPKPAPDNSEPKPPPPPDNSEPKPPPPPDNSEPKPPPPPDNSEPKPPPPPDNGEPKPPPNDGEPMAPDHGEPMPGNQGMKT